jgi:glycogen phosphorylase
MTQLEPAACTPQIEDDRTGTSPDTLRRAILDNLYYVQGKPAAMASLNDYYLALAYTVRDRILLRWHSTVTAYTQQKSRTVCYL